MKVTQEIYDMVMQAGACSCPPVGTDLKYIDNYRLYWLLQRIDVKRKLGYYTYRTICEQAKIKACRNKAGQFHCTNGPAIIDDEGNKHWFQNGERHRINGPAIEYVDGDKYWFQHSVCHRTDGPAVIYSNGTEEYWLNGEQVDKRDLNP